jgi:simple sugar transport system permease protein
LIGLIGVITFFSIVGGIEFLYPSSVGSWLSRAAALGIVAIPVGLLMIAGELDISVGATITSGALITALVSGYYEMPIVLGILASLGFGAVVGLLNGFLVVRTGVPSFIVTLGTLFAVSGLVRGLLRRLSGAGPLVDRDHRRLRLLRPSLALRKLDLRDGRRQGFGP